MTTVSTKKAFFNYKWLTSYLALLFIVAVAGWFATGYLGDRARQEIIEYNESRILLHSSHLTSEFDKIDKAVKLLSGSPWIAPALISRKDWDIANANSTLDRFNLNLNSSVSYLMDGKGMTIASSNRNDSDSFVGKSYQFRLYFTQAIKGAPGRYFAVGATSLKRGFYASYPVRDYKDQVIGVVVIKQDVDAEEAHMLKYPYCFVIDPNGIIFLSGKKEMNFKSLWPVSRETKLALLKSKQFGEREFDSILQREVADGTEITLYGRNYLVSRKVINSEGWSIVLMSTTERVLLYKMAGVIMTILICAFIIVPLIINYKTSRSAELIHESEEKFRYITEKISDIVWTTDQNFRTTYVSPSIERLLGFTPEERKRQPMEELMTPESLKRVQTMFLEELQRGQDGVSDKSHPLSIEVEYYRKDGTTLWMENSAKVIWDASGGIEMIHGITRDISDRKRAEEAVKREMDFTQAAIDSLPGLFYLFDDQGRYLRWNKNYEELSGYSAEEIIRMSPLDFFGEPDKKIVAEAIQKVFLTGQASVEADFISRDQTRTPCFFTGKLFMFEKKPCLIGMGIDITERKLTEKALVESEKKYRNILENIEDGYFEVNTAGNLTFFNDSLCRILGYSADELMGKNNREYTDDKNAQKIFKVFNQVYKTGIPTRAFDWELIRKDGSKCFVETVVSLITDSNNVKTGFRGIARDVTERKLAEKALVESEKKYRNILENIEDGYFEVDIAGNITFSNESTCRIIGYPADEFIGRNNREFTDDKNAQKIFKVFNQVYKTGIPTKAFDWELIRKDGSKCFVEMAVSLITDSNNVKTGFGGIARDVTDRERAEEELDNSFKRL